MAMTVTLVLCVCGSVLGILGLLFAMRDDHPEVSATTDRAAEVPTMGHSERGRSIARAELPTVISRRNVRHLSPRIGLSLVAALIVLSVTRWPVAGLCTATAVFYVPSLIKSISPRDTVRLTEAVAVWTELLRDTLMTSAGLAQAIVATVGVAPEPIRGFVSRLGDRIVSGVPLDIALQTFAEEVAEPSAEQVVSALRLAVTSRAQRLVDLLGALADSTREEVAMRLRVEASRASARGGVRTVIWFSIGFVFLLTVFARSYLAPFGSAEGQLVLAFVGACYAAGLYLMVRLVRPAPSFQLPREIPT